MAHITFNRLSESQKSALIQVKSNPLEMGNGIFCYVAATGVSHYMNKPIDKVKKGDQCIIPDGFKLIPIVDQDTGEIRTYENGEELLQLTYTDTSVTTKASVAQTEVKAPAAVKAEA
jgi:hypothetical protein